jgi:hypothetical protein
MVLRIETSELAGRVPNWVRGRHHRTASGRLTLVSACADRLIISKRKFDILIEQNWEMKARP